MSLTNTTQDYNNYRPDIDGLRALAVLSVIIYHINKEILPGGFVGVDIFFVISGYLISLHIFKDLSRDSFSILEFYRRRVKRIAPAMLVVVMVTIVIAQFLLLPGDAEKVAQSGLWSVFSLPNVYFWLYQDVSYFAAASNQKPLLHLWSLGVEEQFYVFWPLILLITSRKGHSKTFFVTMAFIATASFFLGEYLFSYDPSFVYYMLPTRAGELLVGALLAHLIMKRNSLVISEYIVSFTAVFGLLLIGCSLMLLSEEQVFPGLRAIPSTVGAAMLIFAGHYGSSWPSRLLKLRPMVWIGLISYSAYLWHWPLLAFYRYGQAEISLLSGTVLFFITICLAWLSYFYVECPARRSRKSAYQIFFRQLIIPSGAIVLLALVSMKIDGYGLRWISNDYKSNLTALRDETKPAYQYDYVCQSQLITTADANNPRCVIGAENTNQPSQAILWGDSNAAHYIGMLGVFAREAGFRFRNLQIGSCPPINASAVDFVTAKRSSDCLNSREIAMQALNEFHTVIISANWSEYQSRSENFLDVFFDTARALVEKGKLVILIGKAPVISSYDRLCREKAISFPFMKCNISSVAFPKDIEEVNKRLENFALGTKNIEYYDITKYLCPNRDRCSALNSEGKPIYYDSSHLALSASWDIGSIIYKREGVPFPFTLIPNWSHTTLLR